MDLRLKRKFTKRLRKERLYDRSLERRVRELELRVKQLEDQLDTDYDVAERAREIINNVAQDLSCNLQPGISVVLKQG